MKVVNKHRQSFDVSIQRGTIWGNPFRTGVDGTLDEVLDKYEQHVRNSPELMSLLCTLDDLSIGCSCAPKPCHGDILVFLRHEQKSKL